MTVRRVRTHLRNHRLVMAYRRRGSDRRWIVPVVRRDRAFDESSEEDMRELVGIEPPTLRYVDPILPGLMLGETHGTAYSATQDFLHDPLNRDSTRDVRERLRRNLEVDPPSIVLDREGHEVAFNGAHRIMAAISTGITKMPVEVYMESDAGPFNEKVFRRWLRRQQHPLWGGV